MKLFFQLIVVAALVMASGCAISPVERYVHDPTAKVPNYRWTERQVLSEQFQPAEREVLFVPDFATFSSSYTGPESFLHVFTRGNRPVFIIDAELEAPATGVKQSITLNTFTTPTPLPHDDGFWGARLRLFSDSQYGVRNVDFTKLSGADHLVLTIRWRDGDKIVEQRFPLRRVVEKHAAFVT